MQLPVFSGIGVLRNSLHSNMNNLRTVSGLAKIEATVSRVKRVAFHVEFYTKFLAIVKHFCL